MKKLAIYFIVILITPILLQAQYTGGVGSGDASASLSNVPISVRQISVSQADKFELKQNYPNPFNPFTNIEYQLPVKCYVKLTVYDITGKETTVLVNQMQTAGYYAVEWDAENYPSGIYFYKLDTEGFSVTKKMILIK